MEDAHECWAAAGRSPLPPLRWKVGRFSEWAEASPLDGQRIVDWLLPSRYRSDRDERPWV